jgi:hypothetical protein
MNGTEWEVQKPPDRMGVSKGGPLSIARAIIDLRQRQRMIGAGWRTTCGVGWNVHEKHCENAEPMWRAKMASLKLKTALLHESDHKTRSHEESLWK